MLKESLQNNVKCKKPNNKPCKKRLLAKMQNAKLKWKWLNRNGLPNRNERSMNGKRRMTRSARNKRKKTS